MSQHYALSSYALTCALLIGLEGLLDFMLDAEAQPPPNSNNIYVFVKRTNIFSSKKRNTTETIFRNKNKYTNTTRFRQKKATLN